MDRFTFYQNVEAFLFTWTIKNVLNCFFQVHFKMIAGKLNSDLILVAGSLAVLGECLHDLIDQPHVVLIDI